MTNFSHRDPQVYLSNPSLLVPNAPGYGIELEYENGSRVVSFNSIEPFWNRVGDGSLKLDGVEFVLARPMVGAELEEALSVFYESLFSETIGHPERHVNYRTSTHIHLDIRGMSNNQLISYMLLCYGLEPLLHSALPNVRKFSPFCVPHFVNEDISQLYYNILSTTNVARYSHFNRAVERQTKYSLINFEAVLKQGSVEFRGFPATLDVNDIYSWINMLYDIYAYSLTVPMHTLTGVEDEIYKMTDARKYVRSIFRNPGMFNEVDLPIMEGMKNLTETVIRRSV